MTAAGKKVFIGHGGSLVWRELKDFLQDRLYLTIDEFNRVSTAGVATPTRLEEMLDDAAFAFLILTAEDERADGKLQARLNVVHEAGLFQGRLGFKKAIILLEETCEEFSNIHGLGQLRFPPGKISAAFEEIRKVLEREATTSSIPAVRTERLTPALKPVLAIDCTGAPGRIGGRNNPNQKDVYMKFRVQNTSLGTVAHNCRAYLIAIHEVRGTEVMTENLCPDSVQLTWEGGGFQPRDIPSAHPHGTHSQYGDIVHFSKREGDEGWWIFDTSLPIGRKIIKGRSISSKYLFPAVM